MKLTNVTVKRPIGTIMFFVGVILLGFISLRNLSINLLPSLSYPKITIITEYPGASPEDVEKMVTADLESSFSSISGVKSVISSSKEGISVIKVEFHWGTDMNFALLHIKEKVEEISDILPEDCEKPQIYELDPSSKPIITAIVETGSKDFSQVRETAKYLIKPRLEQLEGISRVEIRGSGEREVLVSLDPKKMNLYNISYERVAETINSWNKIVLAGSVQKDKIKYALKIEGRIKELSEIEKVPVKDMGVEQIRIKDIGNVSFTEKIKQAEIRYDNSRVVALMIYKDASGNTVKATQVVKDALNKLENEFNNINFKIISEEAGLITSSIDSLKKSIYYGALLAFLILLVFLQNLRDPVIVAIVIPIAIIATFVLMYFMNVNINIMSLGGLALGVGMFVDNSIIVIESIFRRRDMKSPEEAAITGTEEVGAAITASTITTIVVFLPVIYVYGITGRLFRDQALTVSFSLAASLFVSLTLLPSLFRVLILEKRKKLKEKSKEIKNKNKILRILHNLLVYPFKAIGFILETIIEFIIGIFVFITKKSGKLLKFILTKIYKVFNKYFDIFREKYHNFLKLCLNKKIIPILVSVFMIVSTVLLYFIVKKELLPKPTTSRFELSITTDPTLGFNETDNISQRLEKKLLAMENIEGVFSQIGAVSKLGSESAEISQNTIDMIVECRSRKIREELMKKSRGLLLNLGNIKFSVFPERNTLSRYLRFGSEEFQVKTYFDDIKRGRAFTKNLVKKLKDVDKLVDLRANTEEGKPLIKIGFKEQLIGKLNISKRDIANIIRDILKGNTATNFKKGLRSYDIVVSTPLREQKELSELLNTMVNFSDKKYRLGDLIYLEKIPSIKQITRESQERFFLISANVEGGKLSDVEGEVSKIIASSEPPAGIRIKIAGEGEEKKKAFKSINEAIILAIILVYMVMAAQFENVLYPFIIMFSLPMGLFGGFLLIFISGITLNIISGIGFLVMTGIVVNDAIVKVDYINKLRKGGRNLRKAILEASDVKLRPILMTTFTTIFGLLPMAIISGPGSELQKHLAFVVIGSLFFATFLTLILIPVLYEIVSKIRFRK